MSFNPLDQNLDLNYLLANGWTIPGNMAYRHILHDFNENSQTISTERIEEIILQYDCLDQVGIIKDSLREFIELIQDLKSFSR